MLNQALSKSNKTNGRLRVPNHEYMTGGFSKCICQEIELGAGVSLHLLFRREVGTHLYIRKHLKWIKLAQNKQTRQRKEKLYRRLSVRECARIQTFPDNYEFIHKDVSTDIK